jgi:hypothetical protein
VEHWWTDTDRGEWSIGGMILTGGVEHCWTDTDRGDRRTGRETCLNTILSTTYPIWTGQESSPIVLSTKLAPSITILPHLITHAVGSVPLNEHSDVQS